MPHLAVIKLMRVIKWPRSDLDGSCVNKNVHGNKGFYSSLGMTCLHQSLTSTFVFSTVWIFHLNISNLLLFWVITKSLNFLTNHLLRYGWSVNWPFWHNRLLSIDCSWYKDLKYSSSIAKSGWSEILLSLPKTGFKISWLRPGRTVCTFMLRQLERGMGRWLSMKVYIHNA